MEVKLMHTDRNAPIGVFDSGIGGLTVAREIMRNLPTEKIVYFGDTARVPYGSKSRQTVLRYSRQIIRFLMEQNVKAIVIACNTASAFALHTVREEFDIPIIGVIKAGAQVAAAATRNYRIGVIGTEGTIRSRIHESVLRSLDPRITVFGKPCPLFVPLVEEGWLHDAVTVQVATRYLDELRDLEIDTLILGCTHYPLIRETIGRVVGDEVTLVNPAYETARTLQELLTERGLLADHHPALGEVTQYQFYVSDMAEKFRRFANSIIPYGILSAKVINIEKY